MSMDDGISVRASRVAQCWRSVRLLSLLSGSLYTSGVQAAAGEVVRHRDDRHLDHIRVLLDRLLDDLRADAHAAHLDVEVAAPLEGQRAVLVAAHDVTGAEIALLAASIVRVGDELALVECGVEIARASGMESQTSSSPVPSPSRNPPPPSSMSAVTPGSG